MDYDDFIESIQTELAIPLNQTDKDFANIIPRLIEYAEGRCYREMTFLATTIGSSGTAFSAGDGRLTVPTQFIDVRYCSVIVPAGTQPDSGTRHPLERVSPELLDFIWPTATQTSGSPSIPAKYAMYGLQSGFTSTGAFTMRAAPAPSGAYVAEFVGTVQPNRLSKSNPTTLLTERYPDLFLTAAKIYGFYYQRDNDAAQMCEQQYARLREGVIVEADRQKSESVGWGTQTPSMLADQPRPRTG